MSNKLNRNSLANKTCTPCLGGVAPLSGDALSTMVKLSATQWACVNHHHLEREFKFKDFKQALNFANAVGLIAETEWHHPDMYVAWGKVKVSIWTHKIDGLVESDFIFAAKVDEAFELQNEATVHVKEAEEDT